MADRSLWRKLVLLSKLGRLRMTVFSAVTYSTAATLVRPIDRPTCACNLRRVLAILPRPLHPPTLIAADARTYTTAPGARAATAP